MVASSKQNSQDRLFDILEHYRQTAEVHPVVNLLGWDTGFKETFLRVLHHDYDTINARSSDLADHQITLSQKAFTMLVQNENDHHAAIQIYVEELLGIKSAAEDISPIKDAIHVRATLLDDISSTENLDLEPDDDPKLQRLESLCEEARADFESSGPARYEKANAARFLRDTVENTILYIKSNKLGDSGQGFCRPAPEYEEKLKDLEQTFKEAAIAAREAHRGEPRRFEKSASNLIPLRSQQYRTPIVKRKATEPRRSPLRLGNYEVSSISSLFPSATLPKRPRSRRSASPRERQNGVYVDRYRPAWA